MIIGVMSDSHDNLYAIEKALKVFREHDIDMLVHLGDIISPFALAKILELPVKIVVVTGNNDGDILQLKEIALKGGATLKQFMHTMIINNKRFLLTHGFGAKDQTRSYVEALALTGQYDVVLFGHTHEVYTAQIGKTLVLNPGEVCGYITNRQTVALIDLLTLKHEIIDI